MHPAIQQHEELAGQWEGRYQRSSFASREQLIGASLAEFDLNGKKWLDAGCGTGRLSRLLAGKGCLVQGVDAARSMLAAARDAAQAAGFQDNPSFQHVETIECLPFENGVFDGILCSSVIEYVENPSRCLAEMSRTLKPGGVLLLTVPNRHSVVRRSLVSVFRICRALGRPWPRYLEVSKHEYSPKKLRKFLEEKGFEVNRLIAFGGPLPSFARKNGFFGSLLLSIAHKKDSDRFFIM
jgi:2-polyprenyl-3-methyl-5-hydroxy-6-metoxy-1,4-benzoquinol methylase